MPGTRTWITGTTGCGNSSMSFDMFNCGYGSIVNIDYSVVCIETMAAKHAHCPGLTWLQMDARKLAFPEDTFDVVLEKGTLDAMMVEEKDPWNVSSETASVLQQVLKEISRVLKPGGRFISVTFAQPHFRKRLYAQEQFGWSIRHWSYGGGFQYFFYVLTKGEELSPEDRALERSPAKRDTPSMAAFLEDSDPEDYLNRITI
ncbi:EEF1A lysine methyltransferase 4 isoform X2 [Amia ocellicauda]|uniref:EEF1A lysine methyltransferase 4 isoform X2 n=1 Tax=Amia ocellicauda TaxID=2972642 RepID=UPI0034649A99